MKRPRLGAVLTKTSPFHNQPMRTVEISSSRAQSAALIERCVYIPLCIAHRACMQKALGLFGVQSPIWGPDPVSLLAALFQKIHENTSSWGLRVENSMLLTPFTFCRMKKFIHVSSALRSALRFPKYNTTSLLFCSYSLDDSLEPSYRSGICLHWSPSASISRSFHMGSIPSSDWLSTKCHTMMDRLQDLTRKAARFMEPGRAISSSCQ